MTEAQKRMIENKNLVKDVEEFITYFDGTQDNFLHGNCYWFAVILEARFQNFYPEVDLMYDQVGNHFAVMISTNDAAAFLFDASGCIGRYHKNDPQWQRWNKYRTIEPLDAARVYRDCVWHMSDEEWGQLPPEAREDPWFYIKKS